MPAYSIPEASLELPRNLALLDTNVLVALADKNEEHHEAARAVIEIENFVWVVAFPVIVEMWGLLVGSRKNREAALGLLTWLVTPGNVILLPDPHRPVQSHLDTVLDHASVDMVDAHLIDLADSITTVCNLKPSAYIATFDTRDFLKCKRKGLKFSLYDMNHTQEMPF